MPTPCAADEVCRQADVPQPQPLCVAPHAEEGAVQLASLGASRLPTWRRRGMVGPTYSGDQGLGPWLRQCHR